VSTIVADWVAVDWGTSNLRAWAMAHDGTVLAAASSDKGMGEITPDAFEGALLDLISEWLNGPTTIIACGMVGAREGWIEADYLPVPCPTLPEGFTTAPTNDPRLSVHIIRGICQSNPADVMRGEETQVTGFLSRNPNWDGVICLPGTHTKWVHVSADEIISFQTFMTGDLFAAISGHTVLKHALSADGWNEDAFAETLSDTISRPERLATHLFSLRAENLLQNLPDATARARLSGLLIGAELAGARAYWLGQQIAVGTLAGHYVKALGLQGAPATQVQADSATLAGLTVAYRRLKGTS